MMLIPFENGLVGREIGSPREGRAMLLKLLAENPCPAGKLFRPVNERIRPRIVSDIP
jgi:hypothetical protein